MPRRNRGDRYGNEHRRARDAMLPYAVGQPCTRCGVPIMPGDRVDLDHADNIESVSEFYGSVYSGFAHASCNRRAGAIKGNKKRKTDMDKGKSSRDW